MQPNLWLAGNFSIFVHRLPAGMHYRVCGRFSGFQARIRPGLALGMALPPSLMQFSAVQAQIPSFAALGPLGIRGTCRSGGAFKSHGPFPAAHDFPDTVDVEPYDVSDCSMTCVPVEPMFRGIRQP